METKIITSFEVENKIKSLIDYKRVTNEKWQIISDAKFLDNKPIEVFLINDKKWYFTDNKCTLKYMNELYELKSADVKSCVSNVIKMFGFYIQSNEIRADVASVDELNKKYLDFIMCITQLANMFVFFDKPE